MTYDPCGGSGLLWSAFDVRLDSVHLAVMAAAQNNWLELMSEIIMQKELQRTGGFSSSATTDEEKTEASSRRSLMEVHIDRRYLIDPRHW